MDNLFEAIIQNFVAGKSIDEITIDLNNDIANNRITVSYVLLAFINYLQSKYLGENNSKTFAMINRYLNNRTTLQQLSSEIFHNKVMVDQDKRDGHTPQFRHCHGERFLDEIFRVIYEFTRKDLVYPKGVCYDFCLFIVGLSLAKGERRKYYIWNSIERVSREVNFILFCVEETQIMVYDPFNRKYMPIDKYTIASSGFKLIDLNGNNILNTSINLTGMDHPVISYKQVLEIFDPEARITDEELERLKKQNYYERLNLNRTATASEIRTNFRRIVAQYHPDKNPGDSLAVEKTRLIIEAYECLKNDVTRSAYDRRIFQAASPKPSVSRPTVNKKGFNEINLDEELERLINEFKKRYPNNYRQLVRQAEAMMAELYYPGKIDYMKSRGSNLYYDNKYNNIFCDNKKEIINNITR